MGLLPVLDEFFRVQAPTLYDLDDRASRNKLEDDLNKKSLAVEPRHAAAEVTVEPEAAAPESQPDSTHRFDDIEQAAQRATVVESHDDDDLFDDQLLGARRTSSHTSSMRRVSVASNGGRTRRASSTAPPVAGQGQSVRRLLSANESAV
jgi:hypothetical protein